MKKGPGRDGTTAYGCNPNGLLQNFRTNGIQDSPRHTALLIYGRHTTGAPTFRLLLDGVGEFAQSPVFFVDNCSGVFGNNAFELVYRLLPWHRLNQKFAISLRFQWT